MTAFRAFLAGHGGEPDRIAEVVCDMSAAFLAAAAESFPQASINVDWFHVVQIFTTAVEQTRMWQVPDLAYSITHFCIRVLADATRSRLELG